MNTAHTLTPSYTGAATDLTLEVATTNDGKRNEIQQFFHAAGLSNVRVVLPETLTDVDETETTFLGNATLKAVAHAKTLTPAPNYFVLAEDSGFGIPALAGTEGLAPFPGVMSNRWLTAEYQAELLPNQKFSTRQDALDAGIYALLAKHGLNPETTDAYYTSAVCLVASGHHQPCFTAQGTLPLVMVNKGTPRGAFGFGYDGIVKPAPSVTLAPPCRTLTDLDTPDKNAISHRGHALQQLVAFIQRSHKLGKA